MAGAAIAGVAGAALLASCGVVGGASAIDELSEAEKSRIAEQYRDCMAEGGLDGRVSFDGGSIDIEVSGSADINEEEALALEARCEQILEDLDGGQQMDPEDEARFIDASADIQKCLGDKGYIVTIVDGGIDLNSDDQGEDFDEAAYLEAEDECLQEVVPDLYEKYGEDG
jgi:hypothetical protein